jgi:hypothetical protein
VILPVVVSALTMVLPRALVPPAWRGPFSWSRMRFLMALLVFPFLGEDGNGRKAEKDGEEHGSRGFLLVLSTARAMEHGLSPFGRANLNPRRNPLDRQR